MHSLKSHFEGVELSPSQSDALGKIEDFLSSATNQVFILKGFAGTGKTFLTKGIFGYLEERNITVKLCAPTGKAAKVLTEKSGQPASTLHLEIYTRPKILEDESRAAGYYLQADLKDCRDSDNAVFIVDEASMLSDLDSKSDLHFGSGRLLADLVSYLGFDSGNHRKLIFIGDPAQLPPVNMKISPALSADLLRSTYRLQVQEAALTDVIRQNNESGVLSTATAIRRSIEEHCFNRLKYDESKGDVFRIAQDDLNTVYKELTGGEISLNTAVIAHSNAWVAEYNKSIRSAFFKDTERVNIGDLILLTRNNYFFSHQNGEILRVLRVYYPRITKSVWITVKDPETGKKEPKKIDLDFLRLEVLDQNNSAKSVLILENPLYTSEPGLSALESKALFVDAEKRYKASGLYQGFEQFLDNDEYFNALVCKFGFAMTCHKAQGSEWPHVVIDCRYINSGPQHEEYFRWLYTAVTRSRSDLHLLNAQTFSPFDALHKVSAAPNFPTPFSVPKTVPDPAAEELSEPVKANLSRAPEFGFNDKSDFHYQLFYEACCRLGNIRVDNVRLLEFADRYRLSSDEGEGEIDIFHDKNHEISAVRPLKVTAFNKKTKEILAPLKGWNPENAQPCAPSGGSPEPSSPQSDFLEEFENKLKSAGEELGIIVTCKRSMPFRERYEFRVEHDVCTVDFLYSKHCTISSVEYRKQGCGLAKQAVAALLQKII
jgi:tRNA A37 threonylcarbamoyladenosine biosynthesis protein TsaE